MWVPLAVRESERTSEAEENLERRSVDVSQGQNLPAHPYFLPWSWTPRKSLRDLNSPKRQRQNHTYEMSYVCGCLCVCLCICNDR